MVGVAVNETFGQTFRPAVRPDLGRNRPMLDVDAGGVLFDVRRMAMSEHREQGSSTGAQVAAVVVAALVLTFLIVMTLFQWLEKAA